MRAQFFTPASWFDKFLSQYRYSRVYKTLRKNRDIRSVLDVGCGSGTLVQHLKQKGYRALGIDVRQGPDILAADLNQVLPLEAESFDLVTSLANLEHLNEPLLNLTEIYRVLKKNGVCILTTPSTGAKPILEFLAFKLKWIDAREIEDHKMYFSKKMLHSYFQKAGFEKIKVHYFQVGLNLHAVAIK